jgi:hypothetical protein
MTEPQPSAPDYKPGETVARRKARHKAHPEDLMMGELQTHYERLCRVGNVDFWKVLLSAAWQVFLGGFIGAAIASAPAVVLLPLGAAALCTFVGWIAVRDTEAETVKGIRADYKRDILDSYEIVDGTETVRQKPDSTS